MSDICKCNNIECINKDNCKRFTTEPEKASSIAEFKYICNEDNQYQWLMMIEKAVKPVDKVEEKE